MDAKEANPPEAKVGFGEGEAVREGVFGVEYFVNIDDVPPKGEKLVCRGRGFSLRVG